MKTIAGLVADHLALHETGGLFLEQGEVEQGFISAVRKYAAYGGLEDVAITSPEDLTQINLSTKVSTSEWGVIARLAELYVERESSMRLEASRGLGADVYGRSVSEIVQDINQIELEIPHLAFSEPIVSLGLDE